MRDDWYGNCSRRLQDHHKTVGLTLSKTVIRVLLVDDHADRATLLQRSLVDAGYEVIGTVSSDSDLYQIARSEQPDVIVVDVESPGRDTLEQMGSVTREQPRPIVMFSDNGDRNAIKAAIQAGVSAYIVDGLDPLRVKAIMEVAMVRFQEFNALREEAAQSKAQLEERKIIERAKGLLMSSKRYSEAEAHQVLQKMAMDSNRRIVDVASDVLAMSRLFT